MRQWVKGITVFGLFMMIPIAFTNCDVYSDNSLFNSYLKACGEEVCQEFSSDYLEIRVNSPTDIVLDPIQRDLVLGGDCNNGGFPHNEIIWELYLDGGMVENSLNKGETYECINGRFTIFVQLPQDGLKDPSGAPREHQLVVEIIGRLSRDGYDDIYKNPLVGKSTLNLVPGQ